MIHLLDYNQYTFKFGVLYVIISFDKFFYVFDCHRLWPRGVMFICTLNIVQITTLFSTYINSNQYISIRRSSTLNNNFLWYILDKLQKRMRWKSTQRFHYSSAKNGFPARNGIRGLIRHANRWVRSTSALELPVQSAVLALIKMGILIREIHLIYHDYEITVILWILQSLHLKKN